MLLDLINQSIGTAGAGGGGCPRACSALPCLCLSLHVSTTSQGAQWQRVGGGGWRPTSNYGLFKSEALS